MRDGCWEERGMMGLRGKDGRDIIITTINITVTPPYSALLCNGCFLL